MPDDPHTAGGVPVALARIENFLDEVGDLYDEWIAGGDPSRATEMHRRLANLIEAAGRANAALSAEETTARRAREEIAEMAQEVSRGNL